MQSTFRRDAMTISVTNSREQLGSSARLSGQMRCRLPCVPGTMTANWERGVRLALWAAGAAANARAGGLLRPPRIRSAASVHVRLSALIPAFTWAPVRGNSVALRRSVFCFTSCPAGSGSSPKKFAQTAKNAERISFGSLRKSRPSALGSRAHSRGFARCAPSKYGSSKRRTRHVSEQNHANRFPRK